MNNADKQCDIFTYHSKFVIKCNKYCNHKLRMKSFHAMNGRNNWTIEWWLKSNCKRSCFDFVNQHRHTDIDKMIWKMCDWWYSFAESDVKHTTIIHNVSKNFSICFKSIVELSSNKTWTNKQTLQHLCV